MPKLLIWWFFGSICPYIDLFCIFNAYPAIHKHCQVMRKLGICKLANFFFHYGYYYMYIFFFLNIFCEFSEIDLPICMKFSDQIDIIIWTLLQIIDDIYFLSWQLMIHIPPSVCKRAELLLELLYSTLKQLSHELSWFFIEVHIQIN